MTLPLPDPYPTPTQYPAARVGRAQLPFFAPYVCACVRAHGGYTSGLGKWELVREGGMDDDDDGGEKTRLGVCDRKERRGKAREK